MIRKLIKKIQNKELIEYISWKFGIKKLVNRFSNNYWGVGDNYNWIFDLLSTEDINYSQKVFIEIGSRDAKDTITILDNYNFSKAFVFEPSYPGIVECIKNISNSIYREKIIFYPFAISNKTDVVNFYENTKWQDYNGTRKANIGASSLIQGDNLKNEISYKVPSFKLSDIFNQYSEEIFLALIDVEGSEYSILSSSIEIFKKIKYICIEIDFSNEDYKKTINLLQDMGFNFLMSKNKNFNFKKIEEFTSLDPKLTNMGVDMLYINSNY